MAPASAWVFACILNVLVVSVIFFFFFVKESKFGVCAAVVQDLTAGADAAVSGQIKNIISFEAARARTGCFFAYPMKAVRGLPRSWTCFVFLFIFLFFFFFKKMLFIG
jgi:hypothetical protein